MVQILSIFIVKYLNSHQNTLPKVIFNHYYKQPQQEPAKFVLLWY